MGDEIARVTEAIESGHLSGDGKFTRRCSKLLESLLGVERVLLTTSGTHALEMCALLVDLQPGDEFVVPSYAFVTTANAFALRGARPVFVDVRPDTLNLDERLLREKLTERTRCIVALHYGGVACEMDAILEIAQEAGVPVVEDNAHGLFGRYKERWLGSLGCLAAQSFHETKNFTCGEGGAVLINRADWIERAEIVREKGTDRSRFLLGKVDKYTWRDLGSSYLPAEILAAFLHAQLERRDEIQAARAAAWDRYGTQLADWAGEHGVGLPVVPPHCEHPAHLFHLMLPSVGVRQRLIEHLGARGILAVFHYQPLHLSAMGRRFGGRAGDCPVSERAGECLLRLPLYADLGESEQGEVIAAIQAFRP